MAEYACSLTPDEVNKAKTELNEDPINRMGAVEELRRWIHKEAAHLSCPTDTSFLLRFLRNAKFSQLVAREKLEKYYQKFHEPLLGNIDKVDPKDKVFQEVWRNKMMIALPNRLPTGERIVMINPGTLDGQIKANKVTIKPYHMFWAGVATTEYLLMDEATQVHGVVFIQDLSNVTHSIITWMKPERMGIMTKSFERGIPLRIKQVHYYNGGTIFDIIMGIVTTIMSAKLKSRINNHGSNLETLYASIPMSCLPSDYLPDDYNGPNVGTLDSCVEKHIANITKDDVRAHIKHVTDRKKFGVDESKRINTAAASFRKLAVD